MDIKKEIKDIVRDNKEEKSLVSKYILSTLIKSITVFGINHNITLECRNIHKLFKRIYSYENAIYMFLLSKSEFIDYNEYIELIDKLDILNEKTIRYIYSLLDDIEDACETNQEIRAQHIKKDFKYITETDEYINEAIGLVLNEKDIKNFFNYPNDFWQYIKTKVRIVDSNDDNKNILYETVMHFDKNNKLDDMRIYVPKIINLKTALINVHEFKHAYDLYIMLGTSVDKENNLFEQDAAQEEEKFKSHIKKKTF